ncbi:MAG: PadR family transcriptional regulator [Nitrospirae bacterium]|nr:PadR family transcriptional regulator [Nitrospirota bacterium]
MSTIDLIILGFLLDRPMNAYELASFITEKQIGRFLKISAPAIYKSCKRLYAAGFLDGEAVKKSGLPEKTVYRINKKGRERFLALMERFSSHFAPFLLDCNAFIWNIEKVEKKHGLKMLRNLRDELSALNQWIPQHEKEESDNLSFAAKAIIKQYRMTISALLRWSEEVIMDYNKLK